MLKLTNFIGKGATRICFAHPNDANKCVKVSARYKDDDKLYKELNCYNRVKTQLKDFLLEYEPELIMTDLGRGLVCQLLKDDNGEYSKSLDRYIKKHTIEDVLKAQLLEFSDCLIKNNIFFYDFNLQNFMVQIKDGQKKLYYVDLKSFEHYKSWTFLHLEKIIPPLARYVMTKRLQKIFNRLNISR